jgi:hypothetical protein
MEDAISLGATMHPGDTFTLKTNQQPSKTWTVSYTKTYANSPSHT